MTGRDRCQYARQPRQSKECARGALDVHLPLVTDRHVDAFTLAGSPDEVVQHMKDLKAAGADGFIVFPFACEGTTAEQTLITLGKDVWPRVKS